MKIIPAILTNSADELRQQVERFLPYFQHFQIDVADGKFVPDLTISLEEIKTTLLGMTPSSPFTFDFDLDGNFDWRDIAALIKNPKLLGLYLP